MVSGNLLGAIISIIGSIVGNIGMNIQKQAHKTNMALPEEKQVAYIKLPLWWCGLGGVISGAIGDFIAVGIASQSLAVASGGATVLVCNCIVAKTWHHEEMGHKTVIGVFFIIVGATIFAVYAPPSRDYELDELWALAKSEYFLTYLAILLCLIGCMLSVIKSTSLHKHRKSIQHWRYKKLRKAVSKIHDRERALDERMNKLEKAMDSLVRRQSMNNDDDDMLFILEDDDDQEDEDVKRRDLSWSEPFIFAVCAGMIGALSMLLAGCASKTLLLAFKGVNEFNSLPPYFFIVGMIYTVLTQTDLLNQALARGDIMIVFPIFQAWWIGFGILGGTIFYQQRSFLTPKHWAFYIIGALMMLLGCGLLLLQEYEHQQRKGQAVGDGSGETLREDDEKKEEEGSGVELVESADGGGDFLPLEKSPHTNDIHLKLGVTKASREKATL